MPAPRRSFRPALILAFAAVYLIWGSTYLAIRVAVGTLPPFLMSGTRFLIAGALLYTWARARGAGRPTGRSWAVSALVGVLLLVLGNGSVTWAEQTVPSGMAALLVATEPLWIVLLEWLRPGGTRPPGGALLGIVLGFAGVATLIGPGAIDPAGGMSAGALAVVLAALAWAVGSLYAQHAPLPANGAQSSGMQMLTGGALLVFAGVGAGEAKQVTAVAFTLPALLAFGYLVVFGSLVAFSAYAWLVRNTTPARASTYAYVNPVVAVLLGSALLREPLTPRTAIAAVVIVGSVALITRTHPSTAAREQPEAARPGGVAAGEEIA